MTLKEFYKEDLVAIYCGDCSEILPLIDSNSIDLLLTDPPYGVGADKGVGGFGSSPKTAKKYDDAWDVKPPKEVFDEMLRVSKRAIIFGGNFFTDYLPVGGHWIVWDKVGNIGFENPYGDCELVWTNIPKKSIKKYVFIQQGFVSDVPVKGFVNPDGTTEKERFHPTQKPVKLFEKIIEDYSNEGDVILDPYLGSGTTCIAAKSIGRQSIGVEISEKYCNISMERIMDTIHYKSGGLVIKKPLGIVI